MDQVLLKQYAMALRELLEKYSDDDDVATLAEELAPLLDSAIAGEITEPMDFEDVPGNHMFDDELFEAFDGLEEAYADFQMEVTGETGFDDDNDDEEDDNE